MSPRDVRLVVNTSPLIHLAEADLLHLLHDAAVNVWVPQPVAIEIRAYGDQDPTARALTAHDWLVESGSSRCDQTTRPNARLRCNGL